MEEIYLEAQMRKVTGKKFARQLRREEFIPAIVYKKGEKTLILKLKNRDLLKVLHTSAGENAVINLKISDNDKKLPKKTVIIREVQHHPVRGDILHVDFNQISLTEKLQVSVPVKVKGEAPGVKEEGVLEHILWEVEVECLPTKIPENIEVDISNLNIGDSIYAKDLQPPEGVKVLTDPESIVISVAAPRTEEVPEEVAPEEEMAEPEVLKQKKPEELEEEAKEEEKSKEKEKTREKPQEKSQEKKEK